MNPGLLLIRSLGKKGKPGVFDEDDEVERLRAQNEKKKQKRREKKKQGRRALSIMHREYIKITRSPMRKTVRSRPRSMSGLLSG
jgi:hypothetical protein